jgi:GT2 family glycosyltransferase
MIQYLRHKKWRKIIAQSSLFDTQYYLFTYPDVREADIDPIMHYIKHGAVEGRNPSKDFDTSYYLNTYKDINTNEINPLFHYIVFGHKEKRNPNNSFDTKYYLDNCKDIKKSGINPLAHVVKHGRNEKRKIFHDKANINNTKPQPCKRILERKRKKWDHEEEKKFKKRFLYQKNEFIKKNINNTKPFVSIIMPTHNRGGIISRAIESALNQKYNNFELIIVDDGSTDNTESIIKNYKNDDKRIEYCKVEKGGVSKARNFGLFKSRGDFIFFLDSDNEWREDFLLIMVYSMLIKNLDAAYSAIAITSDFENYNSYIGAEYDYASLLDLNYIDINAFAFRKTNRHIAFDETLKRLVDWDFILSTVYLNKVEYLPFIGVNYYDGNNGDRITRTEPLKNKDNKPLIELIQEKHIKNNLKLGDTKKNFFYMAVVIHVYYLHLLEEILEKLDNIQEKFDLYITTPHNKVEIENLIDKYCLEAKIFKFNNIGRDIGPFLYMLPTLQQYSLVLKLHTKRDIPNHGGSLWRDELLKNLIPSVSLTLDLIGKFKNDKDLSIAGPKDFFINDSRTYEILDQEVRKAYKNITKEDLDKKYGFFAGTMFWFNPKIFKIIEYYYKEISFNEVIGENGSVEHVTERLLCSLVYLEKANKISLLKDSKLELLSLTNKPSFDAITVILKKLNSKYSKIFFYPDYTITNPYQNLMYSNLKKYFNIVAGSIENALQEQKNNKDKSIIFHLHWTSVLVGGEDKTDVETKIKKFLENIKEFKSNNGIFVWTVHNLISHDTKFMDLEVFLCEELSKLANNIHIHSLNTIGLASEYYSLDEKKVIIGEHGSYLDVYPDTTTRQYARKKFNLNEEDIVFLFLGQIRSYKGIDKLVEAFLKINKPDNVKLIIAGKPVNYDITNLYIPNDSIITDFRLIKDDELQFFLKASDFMVLPYLQILTSGSVYLSLSYGLPVISPDIGLLKETLEDKIDSILYSPTKDSSLLEALKYAISMSNESMTKLKINALSKAEKLTWTNMHKNLFVVFSKSYIKDIVITNYILSNKKERRIILNKNFTDFQHINVEVAIIILHYKHLDDTVRAINSILNQKKSKYEIFIVSNDEDFHCFIQLSILYPNLNIIQSPRNLGYAGGNNIAIDIVFKKKIQNIILMNPDLEFENENVLEQMLTYSANNPDVSIFGPRIMYGDKKDTIWFNGAVTEFDNGLKTDHLDLGKKVCEISLAARETDYVTGACIFIKHHVVDKLGLIPEDYFLYFEETDYCMQAKKENFKLMVVPSIEVIHHKRSEENNIPSLYYLYYFCKSALLMTKKYDDTKMNMTINILKDKSFQWLKQIRKVSPNRLQISNQAIDAGIADGLKGIVGKVNLEKRFKFES